MEKFSPKVDAYIMDSAPFAQPILEHLRMLVHTACPDVEEGLKWSVPHFDYKGSFCGMAAFKKHCAFGFRKDSLMKDPHKVMHVKSKAAGSFGRITSIDDLPSDKIMLRYLKEAMALNDKSIKLPPRKSTPVSVPGYIISTLKKNALALATFNAFTNAQKREYVMWITDAKTVATRNRRLQTAVEWMAEGKTAGWKYKKVK